MHKMQWVFEVQIDHPISAGRPDEVLTRKKVSCHLMDFVSPAYGENIGNHFLES